MRRRRHEAQRRWRGPQDPLARRGAQTRQCVETAVRGDEGVEMRAYTWRKRSRRGKKGARLRCVSVRGGVAEYLDGVWWEVIGACYLDGAALGEDERGWHGRTAGRRGTGECIYDKRVTVVSICNKRAPRGPCT